MMIHRMKIALLIVVGIGGGAAQFEDRVCNGSSTIRLVGGGIQGPVEVCIGGVWEGICAVRWTDSKAALACRDLGLPYTQAQATTDNEINSSVNTVINRCNENVSRLVDCENSRTNSNCSSAGIACNFSCSPACANGGNCTDTDTCQCPDGWEGTHCEQSTETQENLNHTSTGNGTNCTPDEEEPLTTTTDMTNSANVVLVINVVAGLAGGGMLSLIGSITVCSIVASHYYRMKKKVKHLQAEIRRTYTLSESIPSQALTMEPITLEPPPDQTTPTTQMVSSMSRLVPTFTENHYAMIDGEGCIADDDAANTALKETIVSALYQSCEELQIPREQTISTVGTPNS